MRNRVCNALYVCSIIDDFEATIKTTPKVHIKLIWKSTKKERARERERERLRHWNIELAADGAKERASECRMSRRLSTIWRHKKHIFFFLSLFLFPRFNINESIQYNNKNVASEALETVLCAPAVLPPYQFLFYKIQCCVSICVDSNCIRSRYVSAASHRAAHLADEQNDEEK